MWNDLTKEQKNERTRKRLRVKVDESNYFFYPETVQTDSFRIDEYQRVGVYARVSTDSSSQASSFELQQTYYEEFVQKHEKWELVKIYAEM